MSTKHLSNFQQMNRESVYSALTDETVRALDRKNSMVGFAHESGPIQLEDLITDGHQSTTREDLA